MTAILRRSIALSALCSVALAASGCGSDSTVPAGNTPGATLASSPSLLLLSDSSLTTTLYLTTTPSGGRLDWQVSAKPSWVTLETERGTVTGITAVKVTAVPSPTADPGVQLGRIDLVSQGGTASVPVQLTLASNPKLTVDASALSIAAGTDTGSLSLSNTGRGFASWSVAGMPAWLKALPSSGYITSGQKQVVKIVPNRDPLPAGVSTATLNFTLSGSTSTTPLAVSVSVSPSPRAVANQSRLVFSPGVATRSLMLVNPGKGPLAWQLANKDSWLTVSPSSGSIVAGDSSSLTVTATGTSASAGGFTITSNAVDAPSIRVAASVIASQTPLGIRALSYRVLDADFNPGAGLLVTVSGDPSQLNVIDVETGDTWSVALPKTPCCVAIRADGRFAAVAHDAAVSIIDLGSRQVVKTYATTSDAYDLVFPDNGYVYIWPRTDQWQSIHGINVATGAELNGATIYAGSHATLHPSGKFAYGIWKLSPADIQKFDVFTGRPAELGDSPYHGDYPMGYDLWISRDGTRIFTAAGTIFLATSTPSTDMRYAGKLPNFGQARALADISARNRIYGFVTGTSQYYVSIPGEDRSPSIRVYDGSSLNALGESPLPKIPSAAGQVDADGYFLFPSADGTRLYMLLKGAAAGGSNAWAYYVVDTSSLP